MRVKAEGGNIHMVPKKNVCRFLVLSFFKYQAMSNNNFYYIYIKQYLNSFVFYRIKYLGSSKNLWNQTIKFYATKHTLTTFLNIFCNCFVGFSYFGAIRSDSEKILYAYKQTKLVTESNFLILVHKNKL